MVNKEFLLDKKDKRQIEEIHLISGETLESVNNVMRAFIVAFAMAHKEQRWVRIPYLGDMYAKHLGDELTKEGNETQVSILFEPHPTLRRIVGQIEDEEVSGDHTQNDAYRVLMATIKQSLRESITE